MPKKQTPWIIKPLVPDEIYTDRTEFLDYFYRDALLTATRRSMSTVLLGRRRMGKTEIFKRVVNRLFFEQDPLDPQAVVPVFYSFPDKPMDQWVFALEYVENFMRHYVGFYTRQPEMILDKLSGNQLLIAIDQARSSYSFTRMLDVLLNWHDAIIRQDVVFPDSLAVEIPRKVSDIDDTSIVVFLDEFQNTRMPHHGFDIVGSMQEAVESPTCPHFVTGSAMGILAREIIGRGSLFGRFDSKPIEPLSTYWGGELALRTARYCEIDLPELMAPVVADRCGGNPFYINALIRQSAKLQTPLIDEETLNDTLAVDLSSGFIWSELYEQVQGWIERLNEYNITKWILYLSALEEDEKISLERIQTELKRQESHDISLDKIRDVLVKLSRGDLLEYLELGGWFRKIDDPILLEFLRVWGRIEVEGQGQYRVRDELESRYKTLARKIHEYKGYLAEVFMSQILLSGQRKRLPGHFFNSQSDIQMPRTFHYISHRMRLGSGQGQEIDLFGAAGGEYWVCQSKWVTHEKIGSGVLETMLSQGEVVRAVQLVSTLQLWLFAHEGLTQEALDLAEAEGILWSTREQLDGLLEYLGLRKLPIL